MLNWNTRFTQAICNLALIASLHALPASAGELTDIRKAELTDLVLQDCGSCHGMTLKGGLGKPLLPANLSDYEIDVLAGVILEGVPGTPMPPWKALLSPQEARWIATNLKKGFAK